MSCKKVPKGATFFAGRRGRLFVGGPEFFGNVGVITKEGRADNDSGH